MKALLLTVITGVFFLIGILFNKICNGNKNINILSIALSFIILIYLIIFDILPEIKESFNFYALLFILLGLVLLKILDFFVPQHDHHHKDKNDNKKEHDNHLNHIGTITIIALLLHNILENMALYNVAIKDFKSGMFMCLGIGLHNLPLGFQIGSNLKKENKFNIFILTISGLIGGVINLFIGNISEVITAYLLSFTLGMLIYLTVFELFKEVIENIKNRYTYYGVILGVIIIILLRFI